MSTTQVSALAGKNVYSQGSCVLVMRPLFMGGAGFRRMAFNHQNPICNAIILGGIRSRCEGERVRAPIVLSTFPAQPSQASSKRSTKRFYT